MPHKRTEPTTRAERSRSAALRVAGEQYSKVRNIYYVKNISYGSYIESFDYNKVRISYESSRSSFTKAREGTKREDSLYRARQKVYQIAEANREKHGNFKPIFFTLTTKDQTKDYRESNKKIKGFIRRLSNHVGIKIKYIIVPEKHKSGAIHYHGIFFNLPFVEIRYFRKNIWKHGYVDLQVPKKIKNTAAYLSKYLTKDYKDSIPLHVKTYFTAKGMFRPITTFTNQTPQGKMKIKSIKVGAHYQKITYQLNAKDIRIRKSTLGQE